MRHVQRGGRTARGFLTVGQWRWTLASLVALVGASALWFVPIAGAEPETSGASCVWHTVVTGDTLGNLGWAHHSSALAIARVNHIPDPDLIFPGQRFCIPLPVKPGSQPALEPGPSGGATGQHASGTPATGAPSPASTRKQSPAPATGHAGTPVNGSVSGVQAFIQLVLPYARRAHAATGWPTSLILAQWGLEQGWHLPSYTGYNFGNSGALPGEPTVPGLSVPGSPTAFAYAPTPEDGLRIYIRVAHLDFYAAVAPTAAQDGVDAAARALGRSPWDAAHYTATNDPGSWLVNMLHTYNLYQYD